MPSTTSHFIFGDKIINKLKKENGIMINNYHCFQLGSLGPDYWFYYHSFPWQYNNIKENVYDFGNTIHQTKINAVLKTLLVKAKEENDDDLKSYALGFLCHHCFDSIVHPYVYSLTKEIANDVNDDVTHALIEREIDIGLLKYFNLNIKKYNFKKVLKVSNEEKEKIIMVNYEMCQIYDSPIITKKIIEDCFNDEKKVLAFMYDPYNIKIKLLSALENIIQKGKFATKIMVPKDYDEKSDYLNLKHRYWKNIYTNTESNMDVIAMFEIANKKAIKLIKLYEDFLNNKIEIDIVLQEIGDVSYYTGLKALN